MHGAPQGEIEPMQCEIEMNIRKTWKLRWLEGVLNLHKFGNELSLDLRKSGNELSLDSDKSGNELSLDLHKSGNELGLDLHINKLPKQNSSFLDFFKW